MRSSRTRRVARWRLANQDAAFVALSGTLLDFRASHLCAWALAERSPLPWPDSVNRFVRAVDDLEAKPGMRAMVKLTRSIEIAASPDGRNALPPDYLNWCLEREGVVGAKGDHDCPASLVLTRWSPPEPEAIRDAIRHVEETGTRLDREPLSPAMQTSQCQQLSQGFYYVEDPLPSLEWLEIRRDWSRFARRQAETGQYDSEGEIKRAFPEIYEPWRLAQQVYRAMNVARWIDDAPLRAAIDWAHTGDPGIVWVGHRAAGQRLAELGLPYYGQLAVDASTGQHVEHARGPIAASIKACGTGTNLQAYRRALVLLPPASEILFEQLIGRLHRSGQIADEVEIAVIKVRSHRHFERPLAKAIAVAKYKGPTRKLALAA